MSVPLWYNGSVPYKDLKARRDCHRKSDKNRRAKVLEYRKNQRLQEKYARFGGELNYLIAEQAKDDRTYCIKHGVSFNEEFPERPNFKRHGWFDYSEIYAT